MEILSDLKNWFRKNEQKIRQDWFRFLSFASISADESYKDEMLQCAEFLKTYLEEKNISSSLLKTSTFPLVFAEKKSSNKEAKTVLVYGHYDVQPVDPLELWKSDPFKPEERDGKIYARGASDDKGQIFYALLALIALTDLGIPLPAHIKFLIEGEEESQSLGLSKSIESLKEKLQADSLVIVDFDYVGDNPSICLGARGIGAFEVTLTGSNSDLHSGVLGGIAYNPNRALVELLTKLFDENGKVQVPGFYEGIEKNGSEFSYPFSKEHFIKDFGIECFGGEKGKSLMENNWLLPTLEINGIFGGYTGKGIKTVIPKEATAKVSLRLVPGQNPEKVMKALETFLKKNAPDKMQVKVTLFESEPGWRGQIGSPLAKAISLAAEEVTGKKCLNILSGASIPIVPDLMKAITKDVVGMGYALSTDNIHAPNEHFDMKRFELGFLTFARALTLL